MCQVEGARKPLAESLFLHFPYRMVTMYSRFEDGTNSRPRATGRAHGAGAANPRQNKWDTVPLLFTSNSLKIDDGDHNKVGHFSNHPARMVMPGEKREPTDDAPTGVVIPSGQPEWEGRLATSHSSLATAFYSTMRKSRNPYISMKKNDRCQFYSTMKPGGNEHRGPALPAARNLESRRPFPHPMAFQEESHGIE
jgi:hypothetical protein